MNAWKLKKRSADHVLADGSGKDRIQRATGSARIGPGKIDAGDQCVGGRGAALISPQRGALPFARLAVLPHDSRAGEGNLRLSERARQGAAAILV